MKILQITNSFWPVAGGQEKVILEISKGLVERGNEVTVLTTDYLCNSQTVEREERFGFKIVRFKNDYWLGGYGYSRKAFIWLKNNYQDFDVIHCHGYNRYLPEFSLHFLAGKKPVVFSPQGFVHTRKNMLFKRIHDLTVGRWIKHATFATALSKPENDFYEKLHVPKDMVVSIPAGVDFGRFSKIRERDIALFRKKYSIKGKFILSVGRLHKSKGFQYLIEAMKDIDMNLVIIGNDGGFAQELEKQIKALGVEKRVKILMGVSDKYVASAYMSCFAFVLFSEWEGFGIVTIEAMAAGKPVVVSDCGALPFIVKNNYNGLVSHFPSVDSLKKNIKILIDNNRLRRIISKNSKEFSKSFSWDKITELTENVYRRAIKNEK